jgi:hypothetical protein
MRFARPTAGEAIQKEVGMSRYGLTVIVCLLVAGGLIAGQAGVGFVTADVPSTLRLPGSTDGNPAGSLSPRVPGIWPLNDIGVLRIVSPADLYIPFGDTIFPRAEVKNIGTWTQENIPVICVICDTAAGTRVYGPETVYVASLHPFHVVTVDFPLWVPPAHERVYFDTMATANPGDEDTTNDWKPGKVTVTEWGWGRLTYNDGTFDNGISELVAGNELAQRFVAPTLPLTIRTAVVHLTSHYSADYDAEVRVYGNDGPDGSPGTQLGVWVGTFHANVWRDVYPNEVRFDPPLTVTYDTFFVSYYQTTIDPHYPFLCQDFTEPIETDNDWRRQQNWEVYTSFDRDMDFGIDAYYDAPLLDGSSKEIAVPQGQIDSNTTFTPQMVVENAGLCDRSNIPAKFYIIQTSDVADTIYAGTANSGQIDAGQTKVVTFADSVTPEPGEYTVTSITLLPFDARPGNDTLVRSLSVGLGIADENVDAGRVAVSIAPNPLGKMATVRYSLPRAGLATFDVYDVTGRVALTQTIAAGRTGTASLDLRKLEAGVYIVKVTSEGFSTTQKLVVEH